MNVGNKNRWRSFQLIQGRCEQVAFGLGLGSHYGKSIHFSSLLVHSHSFFQLKSDILSKIKKNTISLHCLIKKFHYLYMYQNKYHVHYFKQCLQA